MSLPEVTLEQVCARLSDLGLGAGDNLLVHSAIQFLGRPAGGTGMYLEALRAVIGPEGSLAVPAFNFDFSQGKPYDPYSTPARNMGAFSEYLRQQPGARRTLHPMQSLAILGPLASDLASRDTGSAFDPGSAFERIYELNFKLLLLGADINAASLLHYSEQRFRVPYRYWKEFQGLVFTPAGWQERAYRMFVRDLQIDPRLDLHAVQESLQAQGQWRSLGLNFGRLAALASRDFVATVDRFLANDPWSLIANRAEALSRFDSISPSG